MAVSKYHFNKNFVNSPIKYGNTYLIQIGRIFFDHQTLYDTHTHDDFFELTIVTGGEGTIYANNIPTKVKSGDIFLSVPFDTHKITSVASAPLEYDFFSFRTEDESFLSSLTKIADLCKKTNSRVFSDETINSLVGNTILEFGKEDEFSQTLINNFFNSIIIYLIRNFSQKNSFKLPDKKENDAKVFCYQLLHYIDTHIYTLKSLKELASITGYSYCHLSTVFKNTTKKTLADYFRLKKLETAKQLILEGELKISKIAEILNYADIYAFSKAFKVAYGISPREFKNQSLEK